MIDDEVFGPYRLLGLIGRGGMGEVFRAHDDDQDRDVAVKRLLAHMADDPDFRKRFKRESRAAARLRNPHVVPIHTYGEIDGRLFIDMRLVNGCDLERLLVQEGRLTAERAVTIIGQVASALDSAHREGLVHRDVKPSNILLDRDAGDEDFVYLADFGITRASSGQSQSLTASHVVVGSLHYMAPEQFDGEAGPAADIYSLGCVLYQCLTGALPFEKDGLPSLMKAHTETAPPAPSLRNRDVPAGFDDVVARAMAKDPGQRHGSAAAFAKDARAALDPGAEAVPLATAAPTATKVLTAPHDTPADEETGETTEIGRPFGAEETLVPDDGSTAPTVVTSRQDEAPPPPTGSDEVPAAPSPRRRGPVVVVLAAVLVIAVLAAVAVVVSGQRGTTAGPTATPPVPAVPAPDNGPPPVATSLDRATVTATFATHGPPETVAVAPDGKSAYLTITGDHPALEVLDIASGQVLTDVPVPGPPYFVGVSPDGGHAYVTYYDRTQDQLVIGTMDTRLNQLDGAIPTGQRADQGSLLTWLFGFAISPADPHLLYVPNMNASTVSVLDPQSRTPVAQIPVPASPHWVALTPDGRFAYVTNHVPGQVTVIDTTSRTVVGSIPIGNGVAPHSIAVSPDGKLAEEVNYDGNSLTVIDTASQRVVATTPLPEGPQSIAFAPDGVHSYVVSDDDHSLSIVDNRTFQVTATVPAGDEASMVAVTPDGTKAVVVNKGANSVMVLDVGQLPGH